MADSMFEGRVARLEFNATSGWCLATLVDDGGDKEQVAIPDPRMQTLLETAMTASVNAAITFNKGETNTLTSVVIDTTSKT
jgi:hypothetical protein